ncbi:MAG: hypothetical protein AB7F89_02195 [Pirellulaceae bacterium]
MARPQLRIYYGPQSESSRDASVTGSELSDKAGQVSVPLRDIFPVLADAVRHKRTWLRDFADEEISISTDLYEVILAYQHYRRPSA